MVRICLEFGEKRMAGMDVDSGKKVDINTNDRSEEINRHTLL